MAKRFKVHNSRNGRRVFAMKARPSYSSLRKEFLLRGGGYL